MADAILKVTFRVNRAKGMVRDDEVPNFQLQT